MITNSNPLEDILSNGELTALGGLFAVMGVLWLGMLVFGLVSWILQSIGLYTVAKRRGLSAPILAWFFGFWTLAQIGDKDNERRIGRDPKFRVWLLVLWLLTMVLSVVMMVVSLVMGIASVDGSVGEEAAVGLALGVVALSLLVIVISIAMMVLYYVAQYRFYKSCRPENAVLYLVLGLFFSFLTPFFIFACRNYDAPLPAPEPPVFVPQQF